jgi:hypothetical protein
VRAANAANAAPMHSKYAAAAPFGSRRHTANGRVSDPAGSDSGSVNATSTMTSGRWLSLVKNASVAHAQAHVVARCQ